MFICCYFRLEVNDGILIQLDQPESLPNLEYLKIMDEEKLQVEIFEMSLSVKSLSFCELAISSTQAKLISVTTKEQSKVKGT
jgi:hypothetical protein